MISYTGFLAGTYPHRAFSCPTKRNLVETDKLASRRCAQGFLPIRSDGTEGTAAEKVRGFATKLAARLPELPLEFVDEAYTTLAASAKLREAGRKAKQQKGVIDQAAAVEILEAWMNGL